jgi:hypothetical protein
LWYPGDPNDPEQESRLISYRAGSEEGDIQNIRLRNRPVDPSVKNAIRASIGRFIIGVPSTDYLERHVLKIIRVEPAAIYCVRQGDLAETVLRIPLGEEGIGETSPYVFLMPAEARDAEDSEEPVTPSTVSRDREIQRLQESEHVRVIRTDLPDYIVRDETLRTGGTRDTERLRGQIVAAVGAIGRGSTTEHAYASERIKDLILRETKQSTDGRDEAFRHDDPVLLRIPGDDFPEWSIPIDGSRTEENIPVNEVPSKQEGGPVTYDGIAPPTPDSSVKKLPLQENITTLHRPFVLSHGEGNAVTKPTPYLLQEGVKVFSYNDIDIATLPSGKNPVVRVAAPKAQILLGGERDGADVQTIFPADKIQPKGAVVLPIRYYIPRSVPLVEGVRTWSRSLPSKKTMTGAPSLIRPPEDAKLFLDNPVIIDERMASSVKTFKEIMSLPLNKVVNTLGNVITGGRDETSSRLETFGYSHHVMNHREMELMSVISKHTSNKTIQRREEITSDSSPIRIPRPDALFRGKEDLRAAYPDTMGLIGPWEAFHRVSMTLGDHGSLLYTIRSINEYAKIQEFLKNAAEESAGRRSKIREDMARVQEELQRIDSKLRTLGNIAKHYESRKEIDADSRAASEQGKIILWDESRDNDPMKHLYNGDRLRKITGTLLTQMQEEGTLPLDVTDADVIDDTKGTDAICPVGGRDSFSGISPEKLLDAVRNDITAYNASLPPETTMNEERMEDIVQRVILGGRPVVNGDVALITRHLRTAAYTWNDKRKRWITIKGETLKVQGDDITIQNIRKTGRAAADAEESAKAAASVPKETLSIYAQTLELNRKYRALSKTKDDLELAQSIPGMRLRREEMDEALNILFARGEPVYQKRRRCIKNNRILDEAPFIYDMLDVMLRRQIGYQESDDEGETKPTTIATATDLRKAKLDDTLVVDIEQAVYETGYGEYEGDAAEYGMERIPQAGFITDESLITDPRVLEASRRNLRGMDGVRFINEVKSGSDKMRRYFLIGVGIMEALLHTTLTSEEIAAMVTEAGVITEMIRSPKEERNSDAIVHGAVFCALLLMTRSESEIEFPTTEGFIPPPARKITPSYFYPPAKSGDDERMIDFLFGILNKFASVSKSDKDTASKTPEQILGQNRMFRGKSGEDTPFLVIATRLSRSSPSIVDRSFRSQRAADIPRTYGEIMTNRALRRTGLWETLPTGYRPSAGGKLITDGKRVLIDETPLRTDPFGIPVRENAAIPSPIENPSLQNALRRIGRERSEALARALYNTDGKHLRGSTTPIRNQILNAPAYDFIGIPRERIPGVPLTRTEAKISLGNSTPATLLELLTNKDIIHEDTSKTGDVKEYITGIFEGIVTDSQLDKPTGKESSNAVETFMKFGDGKATIGSEDANGSMRAELFAVHDALIMAIEETIRILLGKSRYYQIPEKGGSYVPESGPLYGIHNRVKPLLKGVDPMKIETGSGGGRLAVLIGENSYYSRVDTLRRLLNEDMGINTPDRAVAFRILIRDFRTTITEMPDRLPRERVLRLFADTLRDRAMGGDDDIFSAVDAYVSLMSHRYRLRSTYASYGVIDELRNMAADYTDVTPSMITEEANKDREMERQLFIYRLDGLDKERKKIAKALQSFGLTLEGKVAADPTRFNAEYYTQQSELVADREIRMKRSAGEEDILPQDTPREREFGDEADEAFMAAAAEGAPTEAGQVEDIDYDE